MKSLFLILSLLMLVGLTLGFPLAKGAPATAQEIEPAGSVAPILQQGPLLPQTPQAPLASRAGFAPPPVDLSHLTGEQLASRALSPQSRFDWRESGKVSPVKNQSACNACYAFASIAAWESRLLIDGAGLWDLSENNVKECNFYQNGCGLGNSFQVASFLAQKGAVLESCDPYVAADVACKSTCPYQKTLLEWQLLVGSAVPSPDALKNALATYGPINVAIYAGNGDAWANEFSAYDGSYTLYYAGTQATNHNVLIVGWDDSLVHAGGSGGWIVKNSWGTGWGGTAGFGSERGYLTIAYGSARIGEYARVVSAWQNYDTQGDLWYYDEGGFVGSLGYSTPTAWALAKFIPPANTNVTRVEFWTSDVTRDVDVYLYDQFNGTTLSGLLASKLNLVFDNAGYHSVALDAPVAVTTGNDVIAVIKVTNAGYGFPVVVDTAGPHETGKTYISSNGSSWQDAGVSQSVDVGIRLRTSSQSATPTATPTTTRTATPTITRTATRATGTPSATATPTRTVFPGARRIYLPLVLRKFPAPPPTATPTATATLTRSATASPTGTPTPTPTRTRTPTPTVTQPTSQGIYGRITNNGAAAAGIQLRLRFYNGVTWSDAATVVTNATGNYLFTGVPGLAPGQKYYVLYGPNNTNSNYLYSWGATTITSYVAGTNMPGGDFDIANVRLLSPPNGSTLPLPVTLTWQRRGLAGDTYRVILFDLDTGDGWLTIDLGAADAFTMNSLPSGAAFGVQYGWAVRVYRAPDSYGDSYYYRTITFSGSEQAQAAEPWSAWTPDAHKEILRR